MKRSEELSALIFDVNCFNSTTIESDEKLLKMSLVMQQSKCVFDYEYLNNKNYFRLFQLEKSVQSKFCAPVSCEAQDVTEDVMIFLQKLEGDSDADELRRLLAKSATEGLLYSHDKIAHLRLALDRGPSEEDALLERLSHYSEPNIKVR